MRDFNLKAAREALTAAANYNEDNAVYLFFHAFGWGAWVDAEEVAALGDAYDWAEDVLRTKLDELEAVAAVAELRNHDYEVKDAEGLVDVFCCFQYWGSCDWQAFAEALDSDLEADVIKAGKALDIPLGEIADRYCGAFDSDEEFAMEYHGHIVDQIPEHLQAYFDWESYTRDLMLDGYDCHDGHYFSMY